MTDKKSFWKELPHEDKMKWSLLIGVILAFISVMMVIAVLLLGRLDINDKWYPVKDDAIVIATFICLGILVLSYTCFLSVGIDATNAEKALMIKKLQLELDILRRD
jgi:predicted RND superfamily exporter protein